MIHISVMRTLMLLFLVFCTGCSSIHKSPPVRSKGSLMMEDPVVQPTVFVPYDSGEVLENRQSVPESSGRYEVVNRVYEPDSAFGSAKDFSSERLYSVKERVLYYGPSKDEGVLVGPSVEYLKLRDAEYDENQSFVMPQSYMYVDDTVANSSSDEGSVSVSLGSASRPDFFIGEAVPYRYRPSGRASEVSGTFQPFGIKDDSLFGRRFAEEVVSNSSGYSKSSGELVFDKVLGWGFFIPQE